MKLHRNIYIWYIVTFFSFAAFTLPIWVIFNTQELGLSSSQAFLLGVLPFGLSAFFEVPTGSWADKYGRARMYQLGTVLYITSVGSYIFFENFYELLIFQVLGALGLAMQSGSLEALVHDSLPGKSKDDVYARVHGRKMAILFTSRVITVLASGYLYSIDPKLPFIVAAGTYLVGLTLSLGFTEVRLEKPTATSSLKHMKETARLMLSSSTLVWFLALSAIYAFFSEAMFAFYQPYFRSVEIGIGQFGVFYSVTSLCSAIGALSVAKAAKRHDVFRILLLMMLAVIFTLGAMSLETIWFVYLALVPSSIAFGYIVTLKNTVTQKLVGSKHQATALSIASFTRTLSFMVSVVSVGVLLDYYAVSVVNDLLLAATVLFTVPFIAGLKRRVLA